MTPYGGVLMLTLVATALRIVGVGEWDFVYDEYFTVSFARERFASWTNPAYYALTAASFSIFGVSEFSARLPALILGIISIPVFFLTWRHVVGRSTALIATVLVTVSTWHIWYSQFSRFYAGVFLFGSLSYYCYYVAVRRNHGGYLAGSFAAVLVCGLFHLTAVFLPAACGAFSLLIILSSRLQSLGYARRIALWQIGVCMVLGLAALPLLLENLGGWQSSDQFWGYGPIGALLQLLKWTQMPLAAAALVGLVILLSRDWAKGLFFAVGIGVPVMALAAGALFTTVRAEYVYYSLPLVFIVAGYLCDAARPAVAQGLTAVVVISMMPDLVSHYSGRSTLHLRDTAARIEQAYSPDDIVLPLINLYNSFDYYASFEYPDHPVLGDPLDDRVDWESALSDYRNHEKCVWIVTPIRRQALAHNLEAQLYQHAVLVSQETSKRFDYKVEGYQVFVMGQGQQECRSRFLSVRP